MALEVPCCFCCVGVTCIQTKKGDEREKEEQSTRFPNAEVTRAVNLTGNSHAKV